MGINMPICQNITLKYFCNNLLCQYCKINYVTFKSQNCNLFILLSKWQKNKMVMVPHNDINIAVYVYVPNICIVLSVWPQCIMMGNCLSSLQSVHSKLNIHRLMLTNGMCTPIFPYKKNTLIFNIERLIKRNPAEFLHHNMASYKKDALIENSATLPFRWYLLHQCVSHIHYRNI